MFNLPMVSALETVISYKLLSTFPFNFKLRRYNSGSNVERESVGAVAVPRAGGAGQRRRDDHPRHLAMGRGRTLHWSMFQHHLMHCSLYQVGGVSVTKFQKTGVSRQVELKSGRG
jgi:hypothetical protein